MYTNRCISMFVVFFLFPIVLFSSVLTFIPVAALLPVHPSRHRTRYLPGIRQCTISSLTRLCGSNDGQAFTNWLKQVAGVNEADMKVKLIEREDRLMAIAATDIKKGELLISVPQAVCIGTEFATKKFKKLSNEKLRTGNVGLLALALLSEKMSGEKSKYYSYIQQLPKRAPGVVSWSDEELNELYSSTTRRVQSQMNAIEHDISMIAASDIFQEEAFCREEFLWAIGMIKSRAVYIPNLGSMMLVPGMDALSFDPFSTAEPR